MLSGLYSISSRSPFLWRTASHESVLYKSPTQSFAEEVANELNNRANALRNSHPSVFIGKQKRLMDGLLDVAEVIRNDLARTDKELTVSAVAPKPLSSMSKGADLTERTETKPYATVCVFGKNRDTGVKKCISELKGSDFLTSEKHTVKDSKENVDKVQKEVKIETLGTSVFGDILTDIEPASIHLHLSQDSKENDDQVRIDVETPATSDSDSQDVFTNIEPTSVHLRLAQDHSDLPWIKSCMRPTGDTIFSPAAVKRKAPSRPKTKRKTKRNACIINLFQCKIKRKSKSQKKPKLRDRIIAFMNNDTMRNIRMTFRSFWSTKKDKITQLKSNLFRNSTI